MSTAHYARRYSFQPEDTIQDRQKLQFADSFLDSWSRELSSTGPASKSTYSSVATASPPTACGYLIY
ncbi:hypothetical protein HZ326_24385 [Fusarium oxysporum f. sp. albedinis]|nr:hypothetical protein HZ326_24385 [Fusarium oxysporum f. sp. albedinis]